MEDEDEESVVHKKKAAEKKGTDGKKNNVRGENNQKNETQIKVSKLKLMEYVQRETKENVEKNIAGNN